MSEKKYSLFKTATALNVGTQTIVNYLKEKGFEVANKPNAKLSQESYDLVLQEFEKSMKIKEEANKMDTRPSFKKEFSIKVPNIKTPPPPPKTTAPPPPPPLSKPNVEMPETKVKDTPETKVIEEVVKKTPVQKDSPKEEKVVEKEEEKILEKESPSTNKKIGLTVVDKIDLEPKKKSKKQQTKKVDLATKEEKPKDAAKEEPKKEPKEETTNKAEAPKDAVKEEAKIEIKKKVEKAKEEEGENQLIKAEAPKLRGVKTKGMIDMSKFDKKPKKKEEPKKDDAKDDGKRKRRKRKKVIKEKIEGVSRSQAPVNRRRKDSKNNKTNKDEKTEISQKEIEEKIKATKARLSGNKTNKRQNIRRKNREERREKEELIRVEEQKNAHLEISEFASVSELANLMEVSAVEVITACMNLGRMVSINQRLDAEIIEIIANEFGHEVKFTTAEELLEEEEEIIDDPADLKPRAPIVTVMGHVDHGKTSLLDYIRKANVVDGEAGGITQHIGAYEVKVGEGENRKKITFLDTPGHEAFTAMRARGAKVTDVAIIIIAADDSIMPQTKEAISHAQAAEVPMIFAINKIDKPGAQPDRIKQQLSEMNILVEEWGGEYQSQDISAKQGLNIEELLEKVILEAELLELKANPNRRAQGVVLEASLDKGRGYVTKVLIQNGTLQIGDPVVSGEHSGKVKAMFNERGKRIKEAGPATPVLVLGLGGAPQAGEILKETETEQDARQIATKRAQIAREQSNRTNKRISLDEIGRRLALGTFKELNIIIKGDVDGSVEALADSLLKLSHETVQVNIIHKAVGQIIESDILLASASDAIIVGFQVRPSGNARKLAEREGVEIKTYSIIYKAIEEIQAAIEGMLEPTKEEQVVAELEVRDTFKVSKVGTVAGCFVRDGLIKRNSNIRLIRDGIVVYPVKEGQVAEISSLKRFKDDAKEIRAGLECGLTIKNFNDIKVGDVIEAYEIIEVKQTL